MSTLLKVLAPFLIRFLRYIVPSIPGLNHEVMQRNWRKLTSALAWAAVALTSILASVLTAVIDAAVQYEQHGLIEFNVVMMLATGTFLFAIVSAIVARLQFPNMQDLMAMGRRTPTERPGKVSSIKRGPGRPGFAR